jgi:CRP/FNR family transcriptional regulator
MSFAAGMKNEKSKVFASTVEDTQAILLPIDWVMKWTKEYPILNQLFFNLYNQRYDDLLDTIGQLVFHKLDQRLFHYLSEKVALTGRNPIKISHREIANELGTAREVVSRIIKKLENEGKVKQLSSAVEIL